MGGSGEQSRSDETKNKMSTTITTSKNNDSTHVIDDGGCIYWVAAPGKTSDEVAAMFRDGYDGDLSDGGFDVTALATDDRTKYAE